MYTVALSSDTFVEETARICRQTPQPPPPRLVLELTRIYYTYTTGGNRKCAIAACRPDRFGKLSHDSMYPRDPPRVYYFYSKLIYI